jgi:hypothetical protein
VSECLNINKNSTLSTWIMSTLIIIVMLLVLPITLVFLSLIMLVLMMRVFRLVMNQFLYWVSWQCMEEEH